MSESDDDEPDYGTPIGLPPEMWPKPMPTIEEQRRQAGEAWFWAMKASGWGRRRKEPRR